MRKRKRSGYLSRRTIRPYGGRVGRFCRATQRLPDFQHQFIGEVAAGDLLPTDDSVDEINGIVVGRKGHQYAAIEYFNAALIDEFGFEADGRAIRVDLQLMVGKARKQRSAAHTSELQSIMRN